MAIRPRNLSPGATKKRSAVDLILRFPVSMVKTTHHQLTTLENFPMRCLVAFIGLLLLLISGCDSGPGMPLPGATPPGATPSAAGAPSGGFATVGSEAALAEQQQQSMRRLRELGRALLAHHDQMGTFPPAYMADPATGKPLYSWRVLILPYLGQQALYDRFDKSKAWDAPENLAVSNTAVDAFKSPADPMAAANGVSYVAIIGEGCLFTGGRPLKLLDVLDGTSNTLAVIETRDIAGSWAAPIDLRLEGLRLELGTAADQIHSPYPHGLQILRCDTSVGTVPAASVPDVLPRILSTGGGEPRGLDD
jgi:uncharacterized protein DUF1559